MNRRISLSIFLLVAGVSLSGCSQSATMHVWQPSEVNLDGVRRIAVIDFEGVGDTGSIARSTLTAQLWDNQHFEVVDVAELTRYGYRPSRGAAQDASALQAAQKAGVDAILTGQVVSYDVDDQHFQSQSFNVSQYEDEHADDDKKRDKKRDHKHEDKSAGLDIGFENNDTLVREATVGVAFRLLDAKTGKVLASRHVSKSFQGSVTNGEGFIPTRDRITADLMHDCAADVLLMIAPYELPVNVALSAPVWSKGSSTIRSGNEQARLGDWEAAEAKYEQALEENPASDAAMHNLAVARAAMYDYPAAEATIRKALESNKKSAYVDMQKRIADYGEGYNEVTRQRASQLAETPQNIASRKMPPEHSPPEHSPPEHSPPEQTLPIAVTQPAPIEQPALSIAHGFDSSPAGVSPTDSPALENPMPPIIMPPIIMPPSRQSGFEESPTAGGY
jgi:tetratricopeptide (TPR) repeat protein